MAASNDCLGGVVMRMVVQTEISARMSYGVQRAALMIWSISDG
ncbi:hypothetical protein [Streptomyces sp. NPDC054834]